MIRLYAFVAAGGAIGSVARFALATLATTTNLPWGTILINILGSFAIGALATRATPQIQAFAMAGLCGGFTTFSAFSLQTFELLRAARYADAALNVTLSIILCVTATAIGYIIAK